MSRKAWAAILVSAGTSGWLACDGEIQLGSSSFASDGGDASAPDAAGGGMPDVASSSPADRPYGSCTSEGECGLSTLHCDVERGACVECRSDVDCTSGERRVCDTGSGRCMGCRGDADCEASRRCETATHRCVERCSDFRPCPRGLCEEATGRCIECAPGTACGDRGVCATSAVCVECRNDADCAAAGEEPRCDVFLGECVHCASNADCLEGKRCDPARGECN